MREELLEILKRDAYKKGDYLLSSGMPSEHYVNCKSVILSQKGISLVSPLLLEHVAEDSVAVAGLTLGADPLVTGVSLAAVGIRELDAFIVRKKPQGHGTGAWIEGPLPLKGSKITVLEDVTTTGGSSIKAVNVLRDLGYEVNRVVTIVDRQEGGRDAMIDAGLELCSLFTIEDFK